MLIYNINMLEELLWIVYVLIYVKKGVHYCMYTYGKSGTQSQPFLQNRSMYVYETW